MSMKRNSELDTVVEGQHSPKRSRLYDSQGAHPELGMFDRNMEYDEFLQVEFLMWMMACKRDGTEAVRGGLPEPTLGFGGERLLAIDFGDDFSWLVEVPAEYPVLSQFSHWKPSFKLSVGSEAFEPFFPPPESVTAERFIDVLIATLLLSERANPRTKNRQAVAMESSRFSPGNSLEKLDKLRRDFSVDTHGCLESLRCARRFTDVLNAISVFSVACAYYRAVLLSHISHILGKDSSESERGKESESVLSESHSSRETGDSTDEDDESSSSFGYGDVRYPQYYTWGDIKAQVNRVADACESASRAVSEAARAAAGMFSSIDDNTRRSIHRPCSHRSMTFLPRSIALPRETPLPHGRSLDTESVATRDTKGSRPRHRSFATIVSEAAIREGNILHWCSIAAERETWRVCCTIQLDQFVPEIAARVLGIATQKPLEVHVIMDDDMIEGQYWSGMVQVIADQPGDGPPSPSPSTMGPSTSRNSFSQSLGLSFLVPHVATEYFKEHGNLVVRDGSLEGNFFVGLLQTIARRLATLGTHCLVCGSLLQRASSKDVPRDFTVPRSCSSDLCLWLFSTWVQLVPFDALTDVLPIPVLQPGGLLGPSQEATLRHFETLRREVLTRNRYPNTEWSNAELDKLILSRKAYLNEGEFLNKPTTLSYYDKVKLVAELGA